MENPDLQQLLSLFIIRPEAHAFQVAQVLGPYRGAEHLRTQIQSGIVAPTFHSSALVAAAMTLAEKTAQPAEMSTHLLALGKTDMGLRLALEEGSATTEEAICAWLASLAPASDAAPAPAQIKPRAAKPSARSSRAPAGGPVWPRNFSEARTMGARFVREPLNAAFLAAIVVMAGYKLVSPTNDAALQINRPQQTAQGQGQDTMFPGMQANPNYNPEMSPPVAEPLPTPAIPDSTQPPAEVPPAVTPEKK